MLGGYIGPMSNAHSKMFNGHLTAAGWLTAVCRMQSLKLAI